jgi:hypothetical protein
MPCRNAFEMGVALRRILRADRFGIHVVWIRRMVVVNRRRSGGVPGRRTSDPDSRDVLFNFLAGILRIVLPAVASSGLAAK